MIGGNFCSVYCLLTKHFCVWATCSELIRGSRKMEIESNVFIIILTASPTMHRRLPECIFNGPPIFEVVLWVLKSWGLGSCNFASESYNFQTTKLVSKSRKDFTLNSHVACTRKIIPNLLTHYVCLHKDIKETALQNAIRYNFVLFCPTRFSELWW